MRLCDVLGCDRDTFALGYCSTHYSRLRRNGDTGDGPRSRASLEERLWRQIEKRGPDECWPWLSGVGGHGYGIIGLGGRKAGKDMAHRVVWQLFNGPIPKIGSGYHGGVIRHICNNRLCCNPAHLKLGTQKQNVSDMWKSGPHPKGNARLTEKQVEEIRRDARSSRKLAPIYGVSDAHIRSIRQGRCWT